MLRELTLSAASTLGPALRSCSKLVASVKSLAQAAELGARHVRPLEDCAGEVRPVHAGLDERSTGQVACLRAGRVEAEPVQHCVIEDGVLKREADEIVLVESFENRVTRF